MALAMFSLRTGVRNRLKNKLTYASEKFTVERLVLLVYRACSHIYVCTTTMAASIYPALYLRVLRDIYGRA